LLKIKKIPSAHFEQRFSFAASRPSPADSILHFFIIFRNTYIPLLIPFFWAKKKAPAMRSHYWHF